MLARPTLTKPFQDDASTEKTQTRPTEERFLLKVDGQIKRSFTSKEDAATAGAAIKKAYPIVVVAVVDTTKGTNFKLLVEERRIVESIAGNENLEIQWRLATLKEAKAVVTHYHKYLSEHSLIKTVLDETLSLPPPKKAQANHSA